MRSDSLISSTAGDNQNPDNGGNITIGAPFVLALPRENNDIIANAFEGRGGNIVIRSNAILGFSIADSLDRQALRQSRSNDISASSQFGSSGLLSLIGLDVDPSQGISEQLALSPVPIDQISRRCSAERSAREDGSENAFYITGSGGLPLKPGDPSASTYITAPIQSIPGTVSRIAPTHPSRRARAWPLREATTLRRNADGQIQLLGAAPPFAPLAQGC